MILHPELSFPKETSGIVSMVVASSRRVSRAFLLGKSISVTVSGTVSQVNRVGIPRIFVLSLLRRTPSSEA